MEAMMEINHKRPNIQRLMALKFGGRIPETVTIYDCVTLMEQISEMESERADWATKTAIEALSLSLPAPTFIVKGNTP